MPPPGNLQITGVWAAGLLFGLVLFTYAPAMTAGFIWDDDQYVTQNVQLHANDGLWRIWFEPRATPQYYPLVFSTFWLEYRLWGLNPVGYHCVNIVLHALNAVLVFRLLSALRVPGAFFAAALFAVAPMHVESVAWVTERKNVLSGLFYLSAFLSYWRFESLDDNAADSASAQRWRYYVLSLLLFGCALLSKSVTCSLPAAILLVLWWKKDRLASRNVLLLMPMFAVGIAAGVHTIFLEKHHVGAQGLDWDWSLQERFLVAGRALCFYAGKLVWPQPLIFIYPKWQVDTSVWWQYIFCVSVVVLVVLLWSTRRRLGRGPLVGVLYFAGTLFPALGFIDVYPMRFSFVADHFAYLASIGMTALIAAAAVTLAQRLRVPEPWLLLCATVLPLALGYVSFMRCFDYKDEETLWSVTLAENPNCWMANFNLAAIRFEQQRPNEAAVLFRHALRHEANNEPSDDEQAKLHHYLGDALVALGQSSEAAEHFHRATEYYRRLAAVETPPTIEPHNNLGILSGKLQQYEEAIQHFRRALKIDPADRDVNRNLGELYYRQRRFEQSEACFRRILETEPQNARAHYNLGTVAFSVGRRDEGIQHLREALRIEPEFRQASTVLRQALAHTDSSPAPLQSDLPDP
jgi:tetratricopeptide (TPR) repeat protein